jgi:hypothetical protein
MEGNITGNPFEDWVRNQVNVRQSSLGKYSNIPSKDLQFYNSKSPFIRVASAVDLEFIFDGGELVDGIPKKLKNLGYDVDTWDQDYLAKAFILQGGVVSSEDNTFSGLQSGLNNGSSLFNGAYGWGGTTERGYVPMPGITNADVQYLSNGALRNTIINVRLFSKAQFQLFDILYLRPGFTLLMEFGWSQYLNNESELVSMNEFYTDPMSNLLNGGVTQYEMYKSIDKERKKHEGNYDAVLGKISNFKWQFNPDGSYDCMIKLTSIGDVIESLKVNLTNPGPPIDTDDRNRFQKFLGLGTKDPTQIPPLVANANSSLINSELYNIYQSAQSQTEDISLLDYKVNGFRGVDEEGKPITPKTIDFPKALLSVPGTTTDLEENQSPQVYIKYGAFLAYLQSKVLLYDKDTPYVVFDMDMENIDEDENVILKIGGQFSSNPLVCLIPYENVNFGESQTDQEKFDMPPTKLNTILSQTSWNYSTYLGRLSNIMVNLNFIASSLALADKEEGNTNLLQLLKIINLGIIESLGDINKFETKLSDDGTKIRFIEPIPQRRDDDKTLGEYTRFNVYGVKPGVEGSFIRSINLTSEIGSNFAAMISIGAQSNSNTISGNATSFSNYNSGLIDRIIEEKSSIYPSKDGEGKNEDPKKTIKSNWDANINPPENSLFLKIYGDNNLKFLQENITALSQHNTTHASLVLGDLTQRKQIQAPFFLPFNFSLEMDGLSGMKLYEKFLMTDDILPPSYGNDGVDLQITGINHSINADAWITKVNTQSVPREQLSTIARPNQLQKTTSTPQTNSRAAETPTSTQEAPAPESPDSPTRREAMLSSYEGVFGRDGQKKGMCSRWTYNLALNYIEFLNERPLKPGAQLAAGGNANQNLQYYNNLVALGYSQTKAGSNIPKSEINSQISTTTWGYGDVIAYWANDGDPNENFSKYGHTQIYVGDINETFGFRSKWSTSTIDNYGAEFVYNSKLADKWDFYIFRAPATAGSI